MVDLFESHSFASRTPEKTQELDVTPVDTWTEAVDGKH